MRNSIIKALQCPDRGQGASQCITHTAFLVKHFGKIFSLSIAALIALICLKVLVGFEQLSSFGNLLGDVSNRQIPSMQLIATTRTLVSDLETMVLNAIVSERISQKWEANREQLEQKIEQSLIAHQRAEFILVSEKNRTLAEHISRHYQQLKETTDEIVELIRQGDMAETGTLFFGPWEARHHVVFDELDRLWVEQISQIANMMVQTQGSIRSTQTAIIALAVFGLLVCAGVGVMVGLSIYRPLVSIQQKIERIQRDEHVFVEKKPNTQHTDDALTHQFEALLTWLQDRFEDACHEIRTLATVIRGEAEVTLRGVEKTPGEYREALAEIAKVGEQLGVLLDDLAFLGRSQIGQIEYSMKRVDLVTIIEDVARQTRNLAVLGEVELIVDLPSQGGAIRGDSKRLKELFLILIQNAIKYTDCSGCITISVKISDDRVLVFVTDNGPGISKEHLPHIFKRFYRVPGKSGSECPEGTGLGLAIAKSIVQVHGGEIRVESTPGKGTVFAVSFPVVG